MPDSKELGYQCFFELGSEGALLTTANDLTIVDVNPAACRIFQRRRQDLIAAKVGEVFDEAGSELMKILQRLSEEDEVQYELRLLRRDGTSTPVRVHARAYGRSSGASRMCLVLRNVSENNRPNGVPPINEGITWDSLEHAAVGIAHVSPTGHWMRVNRKLCRMLGYSAEELTGMTFRDVTHSDDLNTDNDNFHRMIMGEIDTYVAEKRYLKKDYAQIWVRLTARLLRDGERNPAYFVSVVEDITERKRSEALLSELTVREVTILRLLAQGHTNREIADELAYSVSTIKAHVRRIILKLGVSDRTQAAVRAFELGLFRLSSGSDD